MFILRSTSYQNGYFDGEHELAFNTKAEALSQMEKEISDFTDYHSSFNETIWNLDKDETRAHLVSDYCDDFWSIIEK